MQSSYSGLCPPNKADFIELTRLPYPGEFGRPGDRDSINEYRRGCFDWARAFVINFYAHHPCVSRLSPRYIYVTDLDAFGVPKHLRGWARVWIKRVLEHAEEHSRQLRWAAENRAARARTP